MDMSAQTQQRRRFLVAGACALAGATGVAAAQGTKLDEKDGQAVSLGYRHESSKVDKAKYPKHSAQQQCAGCGLFQGKAGDAWGGCPIFAGRQVSAKGWCSAWAKKT